MILQDVGIFITWDDLPIEIKTAASREMAIPVDEYPPYSSSYPVDYKLLIDQLTIKIKEQILTRTLELSNGNKTVAAQRLGLSRYTLLRELKKLDKTEDPTKKIPVIQP